MPAVFIHFFSETAAVGAGHQHCFPITRLHAPDSRCQTDPVAMIQDRPEIGDPAVDEGDFDLGAAYTRTIDQVLDRLALVHFIGRMVAEITIRFFGQVGKTNKIDFHGNLQWIESNGSNL